MLAKLFEFRHPLHKYQLLCAPDPPPAPDYAGAAKAQGKANVDAAISQGKINNPNVINPYGTQTVEWGKPVLDQAAYGAAKQKWNDAQQRHIARYGVPIPQAAYKEGYRPPTESEFMRGGDAPTITQTLNPAQQKLLDTGTQAKQGLSELALKGTGVLDEVIGKNLDISEAPAAPGSAEETRAKVIDAMMSRVNEDVDRQKEQLNSNLYAAGISPGTKAYDDAMALTERTRTDARNQALLASGQEMTRDFQTDTQRRKDAIAEILMGRQTPLNEITALMSGSQVSNPFAVPTYAQNAQVGAAPIFGATQASGDWNADLYNARAAQAGNLQQGLFGLGSAGIMGGAMAYSDRRIKSNIVRLGTHPVGVGWYEYDIDGHREQGVMAQELMLVKPEAVTISPNGYLAVYYDRIGGRHAVSVR